MARFNGPTAGRLVAVIGLAVAPLVLGDFGVFLLTQVLIFALFAASLDLLVGYTGLLSLGHAAYFGTGAYAAGIVGIRVTNSAWAMLFVAVLAAAALALFTGWFAVRTRGVYFLMLTLSFAELLFVLATQWTPVTGGANGLGSVPTAALFPGEVDHLLQQGASLYWYVLAISVGVYGFMRAITQSPFGRSMQGIRQNEQRMRSLGYPVVGYKLAIFVIAGAVAGLAGALFIQQSRFVAPSALGFEISAMVLIMVILGGRGTLFGPAIGAGIVLILRDRLSTQFDDRWLLVLGVIFVLAVYFLPYGVAGLVARFRPTKVGAPT